MNPEAARQQVYYVVKRGELVKPTVCELCECDVTAPQDSWITQIFGGESHARIVAHHWRGYDHPLDVWWICASCNRKLVGKHDGSLTREQARELITGKWDPRPDIFDIFKQPG